jgi:hypothetical protein
MANNIRIQEVIEQAKQQRAELIGSALRSRGVPLALLAAVSLALIHFNSFVA